MEPPLRRTICLVLILLLCLSLAPVTAHAAFDPKEGVKAPYAVLMEAETGSVLYEKAAHESAFPASTTKIMTCILALELGNLDDEVTVGSVTNRGSCMGLRSGEKLSLRDLLYGMMLVSGNDAAEAVAEHIAGSTSEFVKLMNEKAAELGMKDTNFVTVNGLHKEEHVTTAYDFALLTRYAIQNSDFRAIVKRGTYNISKTNRRSDGYHLENTNKLVHTKGDSKSYEYRYAIGVKTGDTDYAGKCFVAAAKKDGTTLIAVMFKESDGDRRFTTAAQLFDWGFDQFVSYDAKSLALPDTVDVTVSNCSFEDEFNGKLTLSVDLSGKSLYGTREEIDAIKNDADSVTLTVSPVNETITAPVKQGELVAKVSYVYNDQVLFEADAYATRSVAAFGGTPDAPAASTPLIEGTPKEEKQSPWLFWILVIVLIVLIFIVVRIVILRKKARHTRKRSYTYRTRR